MSENSNEPRLRESDIQRTILDYLRAHHILATRINGGAMRIGKRFVRFTDSQGVPDIICCFHGDYVAIECKRRGAEQSRHQREFQRQVEQSGGIYCLAFDVKDVELALKFRKEVRQ
jgi:Holliday junction resolvase